MRGRRLRDGVVDDRGRRNGWSVARNRVIEDIGVTPGIHAEVHLRLGGVHFTDVTPALARGGNLFLATLFVVAREVLGRVAQALVVDLVAAAALARCVRRVGRGQVVRALLAVRVVAVAIGTARPSSAQRRWLPALAAVVPGLACSAAARHIPGVRVARKRSDALALLFDHA